MTNSSRLQKRKAEALLDLFGKKAFLANGKCYPKTKSSAPGYNVYSLKLPEALSPGAMQKVEDLPVFTFGMHTGNFASLPD